MVDINPSGIYVFICTVYQSEITIITNACIALLTESEQFVNLSKQYY